ncbi:MAG: hypothetical protein JO284_09760 [Planctomycetaceae bacterium]|nr:hypothetical protein [Planctomycetaceae bacterium]
MRELLEQDRVARSGAGAEPGDDIRDPRHYFRRRLAPRRGLADAVLRLGRYYTADDGGPYVHPDDAADLWGSLPPAATTSRPRRPSWPTRGRDRREGGA